MKTFATILKIAILAVIGSALLILFWAYMIPGILISWIFGERYKDWIVAATALLVVIGLRYFSGHWPTSVGDLGSSIWYVELASGVLSWAVGSIFVSAGYHIPQYFLDGFKSGVESNAHRIS